MNFHFPTPVTFRVYRRQNANEVSVFLRPVKFNAVFIKLPPLRERKEDIPLLINHFLYADSPSAKTRIYGITPSAMDILLHYHWPGNLIQLQNVIERAFAMGVENAIGPEDLPAEIRTFGTISQMG